MLEMKRREETYASNSIPSGAWQSLGDDEAIGEKMIKMGKERGKKERKKRSMKKESHVGV